METKTIKREKPDCEFKVPARPTVRQQMQYYSVAAGASGNRMLERFWAGAKVLLSDWTCTEMPDVNVDLDNISDPKQTDIIIWAAMEVKQHMNDLEDVPKN